MRCEEVEEIIIQEMTFNFPRLTLETICDIAEKIHERYKWEEELIPEIKDYIKDIKISRKECICLQGEQYKRTEEPVCIEETEKVYVWM